MATIKKALPREPLAGNWLEQLDGVMLDLDAASGGGDRVLRAMEPSVVEAPPETLLRIRPGRIGITSLQPFENVVESMGEDDTYSLEIVSSGGQTDLIVRTTYPERAAQQIKAHYSGCVIDRVSADEDPMVMGDGEVGYRHVLHPSGDEWLPFKVYEERQVREGGDPFIDVLGGMKGDDLRVGERLVSRVVVRQQPHDWSEAWRARAMSGTGGENQAVAERERQRVVQESSQRQRAESRKDRQSDAQSAGNSSMDHHAVMLVTGIAVVALIGYAFHNLWDDGRVLEMLGYGVGVVFLAALAGLGLWKIGFFRKAKEPTYYDPEQVRIRISGSAFKLEVQTLVFLGAGEANARKIAPRSCLGTVNRVYRGFDNPLGARFELEDYSGASARGRLAASGGQGQLGLAAAAAALVHGGVQALRIFPQGAADRCDRAEGSRGLLAYPGWRCGGRGAQTGAKQGARAA